ncbi:MAG: BatD family protein [Bacteriovoracaceae bacterium]|nr:BatD family protein [Bacteriovoracaceae bacterium]
MIKFTIISIYLILLNCALAFDIETPILEEKPIAGIPFYFKINVSSKIESDPFISFSPGSLEVLGKEVKKFQKMKRGDKFYHKEYAYKIISRRSGRFAIRKIVVELEGQKYKVKDVEYNILKTRPPPSNLFLQVEYKKKTYYVGERVDLTYYLYSRVNNQPPDVKEFPKLAKFVKRDYELDTLANQETTVELQGTIYKKTPLYVKTIYPINPGKNKIDSMVINAKYTHLVRMYQRSKVIRSKPAYINVLPLPAEEVPNDFTGLVGKHRIKTIMKRHNFRMNTPIEIKLVVSGPGALEKYAPPKLYTHNNLEEFETSAEIKTKGAISDPVKKVFLYTYLGRGPVALRQKLKTFSYFDPETETYEKVSVKLPQLIVSDGPIPVKNPTGKKSVSKKAKEIKIIAPDFTLQPFANNYFHKINIVLIFVLIIIVAGLFITKTEVDEDIKKLKSLCDQLQKDGITYSKLYTVLTFLEDKDTPEHTHISIKETLANSELSSESKEYFSMLLDCTEGSGYKKDFNLENLQFEKKYFQEILDMF